MPSNRTKLLVVDDEPAIRSSLSMVLHEVGYDVRSAENGFSALAELRKEVPEIVLSDLNMPGMSGFELLSVVRRRFPSIKTVAMSGAFCGNEAPSGIAADAFYQKGCSVASLLKILEALPEPRRGLSRAADASVPIWIQRSAQEISASPFVAIACPECLRTFPQLVDSNTLSKLHTTECAFCRCSIHFAIVEPLDRGMDNVFETRPSQESQDSSSESNPQF